MVIVIVVLAMASIGIVPLQLSLESMVLLRQVFFSIMIRLRSNRRYFDAEEYFFNQRGRPPRTREQYIGFGEDMMLTLFLVCILATLVTVHRGACYRQLQDARRNTPLRHFIPIPEDRPPPTLPGHRIQLIMVMLVDALHA